MNESNFHEKITEIFLNIMKKTNIVESISKLKKLTIGFIFFSSIASVSLFYQSFLISNKNNLILDEINKNKNCLEKRCQYFNLKLDLILEKNNELIDLLKMNNKYLTNFIKDFCKDKNLSLHSNLSIPDIDLEIDNEKNNINKNEDYELLNECFDNIPCNNLKKAVGFNTIFGW
jgi:hypothetical protein